MGIFYWYHDKLRQHLSIDAAEFCAAALTRVLSNHKVKGFNKDIEVKADVGRVEVETER